MVFWKRSSSTQIPRSAASAGMEHSEELHAEEVEEPDERNHSVVWSPPKLTEAYIKSAAQHAPYNRRESLLTRQLHSETEHSDDEQRRQPPRALSTQSTWSNQSTTSTAELTSDDGRSMPSPAISPPLPPTHLYNALPIQEKPLNRHIKIAGQEDHMGAAKSGAETSVEATLGRKRCIMFACKSKDEAKVKSPSPAPAPVVEQPASSPPKRKCMIKFACPSRSKSETKPAETIPSKRAISPPPAKRSSSESYGLTSGHKTHRGSDSTVTHASPKSIRKSPNITTTAPTPTTETPKPGMTRKLSNESDENGGEATRFHEFASSEGESEEWMHESSCHRSRLTVNDTLQKETVIRKACEEVEEEVLEEEDEEEADEADDVEGVEDEEEDIDEDVDEDEVEEESEQSDAGFHSDDEGGFAESDSDGDNSDYEWWKPGGSTAATSVEHLDRITIQHKSNDSILASSMNSLSSGERSPRHKVRLHRKKHHHARSHAIPIAAARLAAEDDDLPDSTDFVCGTLDEDRPVEQAYINRMKSREAAKHKARPQDIDPTFPTSDPEMDEEDDEDLTDEGSTSERENMVHGDMEELDEEEQHTLKRRPSPRRGRNSTHHSPPPPSRYHSPPPSKRTSKHHSPPAPPLVKRNTHSPPPPRKLFGGSPRRAKSPALVNRTTSPPNTRLSSPSAATAFIKSSKALAERPQLTHTASLPRGGFLLSQLGKKHFEEGSDSENAAAAAGSNDIPKRGAIDIVKGLEKKRQRRKEKMWQKMCAKAAAKGEKPHKVKPGKGCERMREVGLQLQEYHGKAQHILSL